MGNFLTYLNLYGNIGGQARYLLESTFDAVCNAKIVCVKTDGSTLNFNAIIHDDMVRSRRDHLTIGNEEGIIDMQSKRAILLVRDILACGLQMLDASWYFLLEDKRKATLNRYDFSIRDPFQDITTTPYFGANDVFAVYFLRRSEELDSQLSSVADTSGSFSFDSLSAD